MTGDFGIGPGSRVLGRYVVDDYVAKGGMGAVFKGRHELLDTPVALKVLIEQGDAMLRKRFEREARLMARVRHECVVQVQDFGFVDQGFPCLVMEWLQGEDLSDRLRRITAMAWDDALPIIRGILAGLQAVHSAGILHRDLKPSNVLLLDEPFDAVKLIDFGIAKAEEGENLTRYTATGERIGTPSYMAPEQLLGTPLDHRADLYAAAVIFYRMLSGGLPFGPWSVKSAAEPIMRAPQPPVAPGGLPPIPPALASLIVRGLAPSPDDRFESAGDLMQRLAGIRGTPSTGAAVGPRVGDIDLDEPETGTWAGFGQGGGGTRKVPAGPQVGAVHDDVPATGAFAAPQVGAVHDDVPATGAFAAPQVGRVQDDAPATGAWRPAPASAAPPWEQGGVSPTPTTPPARRAPPVSRPPTWLREDVGGLGPGGPEGSTGTFAGMPSQLPPASRPPTSQPPPSPPPWAPAGHAQPPATGHGQPPPSGYGQPPAGYDQPPTTGYGQPPVTGYGQPPATGYGQPQVPPADPYGQPAAPAGPSRFLVGAQLPAARLRDRGERQFLAGLLQRRGRAWTLGAGTWFALMTLPDDRARAEAVGRIRAALQERYGDVPVEWLGVGGAFNLTAASLSGAEPLPPELASLVASLAG